MLLDDHRPVADRRRGSRREARKKGRLRWLCNPLVLRTIIALANLVTSWRASS